MRKRTKIRWAVRAVLLAVASMTALGQTGPGGPSSYSIATPKPINPAEGTTTPSAQATQQLNPYLSSVPVRPTGTTVRISLEDAIGRGLRYNLGLVESNQASADVRAERLRALAALLPQIEARGEQTYEALSYKEIGLKLPAIPGFPALPPTSGGFGYQDVRIGFTQSVYDKELRERYQTRKENETASALSVKDARDVVALAVGGAYFQVIASEARLETARAELASARELDTLTANRVNSEVSPEIESLRAQVQRQSAEQRLTNIANELEKDRLTLARVTGLSIDQKFELIDRLTYCSLAGVDPETATQEALRSRSDLASAEASVRAAESAVRAAKAQRLPVVSLRADYGGGGPNFGNFNQVYTVSGDISVPIYTGGRIRADIDQTEADLARRRAEYEDLRGRIAYDVRVAWLDASASDSSVKVAEANRALAEKALVQSRDRYANGVTNFLEVVQAQETVAGASENYIASLYSFDVAMISLARAIGGTDLRLRQLMGAK